MALQGPRRSNYVEQLLSLTGPRPPGGEHTHLGGRRRNWLPTF